MSCSVQFLLHYNRYPQILIVLKKLRTSNQPTFHSINTFYLYKKWDKYFTKTLTLSGLGFYTFQMTQYQLVHDPIVLQVDVFPLYNCSTTTFPLYNLFSSTLVFLCFWHFFSSISDALPIFQFIPWFLQNFLYYLPKLASVNTPTLPRVVMWFHCIHTYKRSYIPFIQSIIVLSLFHCHQFNIPSSSLSLSLSLSLSISLLNSSSLPHSLPPSPTLSLTTP